jgi:hypothetical protein
MPVVPCHDKLSRNDSICRIFDILSLLLGTGLCVDMFPRNNGMFSLEIVVYCPIFRLLL